MTKDNSKEMMEEELQEVTGGARKVSGAKDCTTYICTHCKGRFTGGANISFHLQQTHGVSTPLLGRDYMRAVL